MFEANHVVGGQELVPLKDFALFPLRVLPLFLYFLSNTISFLILEHRKSTTDGTFFGHLYHI